MGFKELDLIAGADFRGFPPRLPTQPIFYPVLNFEYAVQIARDWNTKDPASGFAGFVLRFEVDDAYVEQFPIQTVGSSQHQELWVPAEVLETFNQHIVGKITIEASFYSVDFQRKLPS